MNFYQQSIREELAGRGYIGRYDPRHIEGYMRLEHGTLDALSASRFSEEIEISRQCIDADSYSNAESLAKSFGL